MESRKESGEESRESGRQLRRKEVRGNEDERGKIGVRSSNRNVKGLNATGIQREA